MKKHNFLFIIFMSLVTLNAQDDAQDIIGRACETLADCPRDYKCFLGECVPDVDADIDRDGVPNWIDNCRDISNTQQTDLDRNGIGDACQQSEVRIGKIWGDIKYVDGRGRVRPFRATAKLMREGEYGSNLFDESTELGNYQILGIPLSANDIDDYRVEIFGNPARLNNNTLWGMDLSDDFKRNIDINFSQANGHSHQVDFLIYPPGDIIGAAKLPNKPIYEGVHGGTKVTVVSVSIESDFITKTDITSRGGGYEIRRVNKVIRDFSAICCVTGRRNDSEWVISPRYISRIDSELNVAGLGTTIYDITMEEFIPNYVELMRLSAKELSRERFKSSLNYGQEALNELKNAKQSSIVDEALINTNLGSVSLINGQFQDALSYFDTALEILDKNATMSNALSLAVNNHKMLIYEKMGNFKLMEESQGEIEEILNDLSQKSPDHSFNIIDDLILKVHPSMYELFMQKLSENDLVERLKMCSENEFYADGKCIPFNFEKNSKKR